MTFHIFAAVAEFEADLICARTVAGLDATRARGRTGGRPSVMTPDKRAAADEPQRNPGSTAAGVARALGVSRPALHRYLASRERARSERDGVVGVAARRSVGACRQTWPMGSDGFEGWTDEDDARLELEALPSWHPALFVDVFRIALAAEPNEGNALLRLGFVTPESVQWWGDFSGARMLLGAGLKISMSALYAADALDVAYVRLVETDQHRSAGTVRPAATAHATLVWRPGLLHG